MGGSFSVRAGVAGGGVDFGRPSSRHFMEKGGLNLTCRGRALTGRYREGVRPDRRQKAASVSDSTKIRVREAKTARRKSGQTRQSRRGLRRDSRKRE